MGDRPDEFAKVCDAIPALAAPIKVNAARLEIIRRAPRR
jgi:hypothetical protein